jgi:hypothetical protein
MAWYQIDRDQLDTFRRSWPCHGLPDELDTIAFEYDVRGEEICDLIDIEARDEDGKLMDSSEFDGPALQALSLDAPQIGTPL